MSPKSGGRAQRRQRRNLWISVIAVVVISLGSFAAVFAAKWSPRLGLDLAGGVSVVYTAQGQARLPGGPRRDRQHPEPPRQRARCVRRAGGDHREEPDLGLHSRGDERATGAEPDRADGTHVLPSGALLRLPPGRPEGLEGQGGGERHRDDSRLFVGVRAHRGQPRHQYEHRRADQQHRAGQPVRGVPVDERREAELRRQHRSAAGHRHGVRRSGLSLRARAFRDVGPFDRQRAGHAEPDG